MKVLDIEALQSQLDERLSQFDFGTTPSELYDPIRYILTLGGKRLRPILAILSAKMYGETSEQVIDASLAVEIFHNFTLMHDDIMDEAPLRRGSATVHEKWNQNIAILSGDVMMVKAYDALLTAPSECFKEIIQSFNTCSREVCEGQQYDMNFETRDDVSEDEYLEMIKLKTAVLLGFSLELGAILGGASSSDRELLREFGTLAGKGFQLKDDLLDVFGEQAKVGKHIGGDIISNKKTYLLIKAYEKAEGNDLKELTKWIEAESFDSTKKVEAVSSLYKKLGVVEDTENLISDYFKKAFDKLSSISVDQQQKEELISFTNYLINRDH